MTKFNEPPILDHTSARCAILIRRAHAHCSGEDAAWDAWAAAVIDRKGLQNNATVAMPLATDAFLRGLQLGLKAHLPIESGMLEDATSKFGRLTLKAYARQEASRAFGALAIDHWSKVNEACRNGENALEKLGAPH